MEEPAEIKHIPLKVLSPHTVKILGMHLNRTSETLIPGCDKVPDYRGLAELFNKSFTFIQSLEDKPDPTAELLKSLKGPEATLTHLWSRLAQLGRTDILQKCSDLFVQDTKRWQHRKPRDRFEAEEVKLERRRNDIKNFFDEPAKPMALNPELRPEALEISANSTKRDKPKSKIKALFTSKLKSVSHCGQRTRSDNKRECVQTTHPQSKGQAGPCVGIIDQVVADSLTSTSTSGSQADTSGDWCESESPSRSGSVRSFFSSLPAGDSSSERSSSSFTSLPNSSSSYNGKTSPQLHDASSSESGPFVSKLPEPLLTIEDCDGHRAMFDAYINSAEDDIPRAKEMLRILEAEPYNLRLFLSERQLMPGGSKYEDIARVVEERCHGKVVIILTRHYQNSEGCQFVTNFARSLDPAAKRKQIIPITYEKIELPTMLKGMHIISKERDERRGWFWQKLTEAIKQL